jgi:hypothetical protein
MKTAFTRDEHLAWIDATIELFSDPNKWTAKYWAKAPTVEGDDWVGLEEYDEIFRELFPQATCYCIEGGLYKTALDLGYADLKNDAIYDVLRLGEIKIILRNLITDKGFVPYGGYEYINAYNDELGYEAVMALLKEAREQVASMGESS